MNKNEINLKYVSYCFLGEWKKENQRNYSTAKLGSDSALYRKTFYIFYIYNI